MEVVGIFYDHLVYFVTIWSILRPFGIFFPRFGILHQEKSGNPGREVLIFWREIQTLNYRGKQSWLGREVSALAHKYKMLSSTSVCQ
jgi:hypothetical protein